MPDFLPDTDLNVITPSIEVFLSLKNKENTKAILAGGVLNKKTQNLVGNLPIEIIKRFSFSISFISADGIDLNKGSLEFDYEDSLVKQAIVEASDKVILLIDSSKIEKNKGILTCPMDKIYKIIYDDAAHLEWPENVKEKLEQIKG